MTIDLKTGQRRRYRGVILELLSVNHYERRPRMDDVMLWGAMSQVLGDTIGQELVCTLIEELKDGGYLEYKRDVNRATGAVHLLQLQLTASGRQVVERYKEDPMILIP